MAKREAAPRLSDLLQQAQGMPAVNPILAPQIEQFWKAQDGILEETEAFTRAWYKRRHEAAQSALEALRRMTGDGADRAAGMQAMAEWQRHSLERMTEDVRQWMDLWSRCAGRLGHAETEAAGEALDAAAGRMRTAASTKHATPV